MSCLLVMFCVTDKSSPLPASQRPSTALDSHFPSSVTSSAGAFPSRESRLRRSLRDGARDVRCPAAPVVCPLSAWTAAAAVRDHRRSVDVDSAAAAAMAARPSAVAGAVASSPGKDPSAAGGGLSLSSTASNDTGYSSIGNEHSAAGTCRPAPPPADDVRDDVEQRPSVAELRQRFQTHSISQPTELSKRCAASFSTSPSAAGTRLNHLLSVEDRGQTDRFANP